MIEFKIKTWACGSCSYRQDFEMTQEQADIHFNHDPNFGVSNLKVGECPSCLLKGSHGLLQKENDNDKKSVMRVIDSQEDIDELRIKMLQDTRKKSIGAESRLETDEEHDDRINGLDISEEVKVRLKQEKNKVVREFPVFMEETEQEKKERVEEELAKLEITSPEEIQALRDKYEDK